MSSDERLARRVDGMSYAGGLFARGIITAREYAVYLYELDNQEEE